MHMLRSHGWKWVGIALLFFIPLISLYALEVQLAPLENAYQSVSSDFQIADSDGLWRDYEPDKHGETKVTGTYRFKTVLPDNRWRDPHMYLVGVPNAEVYLDNERIFSFAPHFEYREHPNLIRLPDDFSGKTLMLQIDIERQLLYPGFVMIDEPLYFVIKFLLQSDYRLLLAIVSFLGGLAGFILYLGRREAAYLYVSLFALYIAQLCLSRSWFLLGMLADSPAFPYFQDVLLPLGGYVFIRFYEHLFGTSSYPYVSLVVTLDDRHVCPLARGSTFFPFFLSTRAIGITTKYLYAIGTGVHSGFCLAYLLAAKGYGSLLVYGWNYYLGTGHFMLFFAALHFLGNRKNNR